MRDRRRPATQRDVRIRALGPSREELFLVRDRVVRALVKGLKSAPPIDPQALNAYLGYLSVPGDLSIYAGVHKVPPASVIMCTRGGTHIERYSRLSFRDKIVYTESEAIRPTPQPSWRDSCGTTASPLPAPLRSRRFTYRRRLESKSRWS